MSTFDPASLRYVTVYLNGKINLYENVIADFTDNRLAVLYNMYAKF